jgi:hypothetical protein
MREHTWVIMPVLAGPEMTEAALGDLLAQTVPTRILIVNQGVEPAFRARLEQIAEEYPDRVLVWSHVPPLPSLSATWNRALRFVWELGGTEAFVMNNDLRLLPWACDHLHRHRTQAKALFVSGVGVTEEQYRKHREISDARPEDNFDPNPATVFRGGPDFSCFLISREGHEKYPFDEAFTPAFCEDLDLHRRMMLGGDGERIFSVNIPYWHLGGGSQTLKSLSAAQRAVVEGGIARGSREHYRAKWGGDVNAERYTIPFDPTSAQDGVDTPTLQRALHVPVPPTPSLS